jgi:hypothetical protein
MSAAMLYQRVGIALSERVNFVSPIGGPSMPA